MARTDYLTDEEIEGLKGKPFGIEPKRGFKSRDDREEFVKRAGDLFKVKEYSDRLRENSGNLGILRGLAEIVVDYMPGDKRENAILLQQNPYLALEQGEILYNTGVNAMGKLFRNNADTMLSELFAEQLYSLIRKVPLVKVGDESLDKMVDAVEEVHKISIALHNRERGGIESYIIGRVKGTERERVFAYGRNNPDYVQRVFQAYAKQAELDLRKAVSREVEKEIEGEKVRVLEPDKSRLYSLVEKSYKKVKSDKGEDSDEAKAYHLAIAGAAYDVLKEEKED